MRSPFSLRLGVVVLALVCVAACAGRSSADPQHAVAPAREAGTTGHGRRGRSCDRSDQDTSSYAHAPLYLTCAVDVPARLVEQRLQPDFRPDMHDRACYSARLTVAVDVMGHPEPGTVHIVRYTDRAYAQAVEAAVPGFRFEPARLEGEPVRQVFDWVTSLTVRRVGPSDYGPLQPMPGRAPC
jgi:hypothetical protein